MLHPRVLLSKAYDVVVKAAEIGSGEIDAKCVKAAFDGSSSSTTAVAPDATEGIDGAI